MADLGLAIFALVLVLGCGGLLIVAMLLYGGDDPDA